MWSYDDNNTLFLNSAYTRTLYTTSQCASQTTKNNETKTIKVFKGMKRGNKKSKSQNLKVEIKLFS